MIKDKGLGRRSTSIKAMALSANCISKNNKSTYGTKEKKNERENPKKGIYLKMR